MMNELNSEKTYEEMVERSRNVPVFLLKHSLTCPVSSGALYQFERFLAENEEVPGFLLKIQENRELSNTIAAETGVVHQSPQALLFRDGEVVWNASHHSISVDSLSQSLE